MQMLVIAITPSHDISSLTKILHKVGYQLIHVSQTNT